MKEFKDSDAFNEFNEPLRPIGVRISHGSASRRVNFKNFKLNANISLRLAKSKPINRLSSFIVLEPHIKMAHRKKPCALFVVQDLSTWLSRFTTALNVDLLYHEHDREHDQHYNYGLCQW